MGETDQEAKNNQKPRFDQCHYDFLKQCSGKGEKGLREWNEWRQKNTATPILFEGADFGNAKLNRACLRRVQFRKGSLKGAQLLETDLRGAEFRGVDMCGADLSRAIVDGETLIWMCPVDSSTKLEGVVLDSARIYPATRIRLEYNIRRMNWEEWYRSHRVWKWLVKPFWSVSDYGLSTGRIVATFFILALIFAAIYANVEYWFPPGVMSNLQVEPHLPLWHYSLLLIVRPVYFSVVTMTTLGFGDMYANALSVWGHILLIMQVLLGYVLLGALVTRFAVLFTAGGPAGRFAERGNEQSAEKEEAT